MRVYDTDGVLQVSGSGGGSGFITAVSDTASVDLTVTGTTLTADTIDDSSNQRVQCAWNGSTQGTRHRLNFLDTASLTWTIADDAGGNEIEVSGNVVASAPALTDTYIGFGDPTNLLTGSSDLTWDDTAKDLSVLGTIDLIISNTGNVAYIAQGNIGYWYTGAASTGLLAHQGFGIDFNTDELYTMGAVGLGNDNYIEIDDTNSTVTVSTLAGTGTQMVTADINGVLAKQAIPSVTPAALTRVDDTNVTLTLGGTPATALLQATSITAGWTGQLSVARGGTGASTSTAALLNLGITPLLITGGSNVSTTLATAVDITGLTMTAEASSIYIVDGMFKIGCNNTGGLVMACTIPSGTMSLEYIGIATNGGTINAAEATASGTLTTTARAWNQSNSAAGWCWVRGTVTTGVTPGTLKFQFASAVAGQTSTVYVEGTYVRITKVA